MIDLGNKVFLSSMLMLSAQWIERLIGLVSIVILARILLPDDYGIAALAQVVILFFQILLADGAEAYLIRKKNPSEVDYNTAWTTRAILFIVIGLMIYFARRTIADFMNEPRLVDVLAVSSLSTLISGFKNIGLVEFKKNFNYKPLFFIKLYRKLIGLITTILIALIYQNYWALIVGILAMQFAEVLLSYYYSAFQPKFSLAKIKEQWEFTKWLIAGNVTIFIRNKSNDVIIPKFMGTSSLGSYSMAYNLALMPYEQIIQPIISPTYASFASVRHENKWLSSMFIKVTSIVSIILLPAYAGAFFLSEEIITVLLGKTWLSITEIFKILLFFVSTQAYIGLFTAILTSLGQVKIIAIVNWLLALILLPILIYTAINKGLEELVLYRTGLALLFMLVFLTILCNKMWLDLKALIFALLRPAIAITIMYFFMIITKSYIQQPTTINMIAVVICSIFVYVTTLLTIWIIFGRKIGGEEYILDKALQISSKFEKLNLTTKIIKLMKN